MAHTLRPLMAAVASSMIHKHELTMGDRSSARPFITISREAGAGGHTLMNALVERLSQLDPADPPWTGYDRGLIDQVVARHGIDRRRIDQLENNEPSWLLDVLEGIGSRGEPVPTEAQVYRKVVQTIRQLAHAGRAVIVGRGSALATADMPGGLHVRLVAPLEQRVENFARLNHMSAAHAAAEVQRLDKAREHFYQRFWRMDRLDAEHFDLTINTARHDEATLVGCILALTPNLKHAAAIVGAA